MHCFNCHGIGSQLAKSKFSFTLLDSVPDTAVCYHRKLWRGLIVLPEAIGRLTNPESGTRHIMPYTECPTPLALWKGAQTTEYYGTYIQRTIKLGNSGEILEIHYATQHGNLDQ